MPEYLQLFKPSVVNPEECDFLGEIDAGDGERRLTRPTKACSSQTDLGKPESMNNVLRFSEFAETLKHNTEKRVDAGDEFKDYKPSQDAHVEVSENSVKGWEHPKWWTETDEGSHIMLLHSKTIVYCTCMC